MKNATLRVVAVLALLLCLLLAGCHKKKPAVPAAANAPTVQPSTQPTTTPVTPPPAPTTTTTTQPQPQPTPPPKPSANKKKTHAEKKTTPPPTTTTAKNHTVVNDAGSNENKVPQISAATTDPTLHPLTTAQLLDATDNNLKNIHRTLTADEQAMVQQIQDFEKQSREATAQGDTVRAYNLAVKAHLLSDELAHK